MVQPASSAGISLVTIRNCGMFHGTMAATTPIGSRRIAMSEPYSPGRFTPRIRLGQIAERIHHRPRQCHLGPLGEADRGADLRGDERGHLRAPITVGLGEPAYGVNAFGGG